MSAPKHLRAAEFQRCDLFLDVRCFSELERRIEALPDEQLRGDAFEVFAEAYLATQRVEMAKHVWPDKVIPPSLRKRLRLFVRDVGADGVIETVSGKHRAYQVKFRSRRTPLTWTETATFFGLTDHCDDRLLFTNSEDVSEVAEQRKGFSSIRGTDLDAMTVEDFDAIRAWLPSIGSRRFSRFIAMSPRRDHSSARGTKGLARTFPNSPRCMSTEPCPRRLATA